MGYRDIVCQEPSHLELERVYNSKSGYVGWFGTGWGTAFEAHLTFRGDRTVTLTEYGGGRSTTFAPENYSDQDAIGEAHTIVAAEGDKDVEREKALTRSDEMRADAWATLFSQHKVVAPPFDSTIAFRSEGRDRLRREGDLWVVEAPDGGIIRRFDATGRLRALLRQGTTVTIDYDSAGSPSRVYDSAGGSLELFMRASRVVAIRTKDGRHADYRYNSNNELVQARDAENNINTYEYSYDTRQNLIRIGYDDGTELVVWYYPREQHENVRRIRERDGSIASYIYKQDEQRNAEIVEVMTADSGGSSQTRSSYTYYVERATDGTPRVRRLVENVDGEVTETKYDLASGQVEEVRRGSTVDRRRRDDRGRLVEREIGGTSSRFIYGSNGKIARVEVESGAPHTRRKDWYAYEYDQAGNLVLAQARDGRRIELTIDEAGRITALKETGLAIRFEYLKSSKPTRIEVVGVGALDIAYGGNGEVASVNSSRRREIAKELSAAFQRLLDLVRPASFSELGSASPSVSSL